MGELNLRSTSADCLNSDKEVKLLAISAATKQIFLAGSSPDRRLGVTEEDKSETYVAQKRMLYPRKLGEVQKDPLRERYITDGDVPATYDGTTDSYLGTCL